MKHELQVKSTVIDWPDETLTITDLEGVKHTVTLDTLIHVTMIGYPDREQRMMPARDLGAYMSHGYMIMQIDYED